MIIQDSGSETNIILALQTLLLYLYFLLHKFILRRLAKFMEEKKKYR
jgi:F0F1-type ATP synthase membrane subunit b/b'